MSIQELDRKSRDQAFTEENRAVLSRYWHPVAFSSELGNAPLGVVLLDQPLVLYRVDGKPAAALDRCPHRGARLSRGWMEADNLVCPYHGLHYDGEGRCTKIPAAPDAKIPRNLRLEAVACQEAKNLIWICLAGEADGEGEELLRFGHLRRPRGGRGCGRCAWSPRRPPRRDDPGPPRARRRSGRPARARCGGRDGPRARAAGRRSPRAAARGAGRPRRRGARGRA